MYALKRKDRLLLSCVSETADGHKKLVHMAFSNWAGMQPRGKNALFSDFMDKYESVTVKIEPINFLY